MARRKAEVALQMTIETQEEWEETLAKDGLNVIDVYQEWCGPCAGMVSNFKKMKNEVGDPLLKFAIAKADTIDSLERYRGHCEPCFQFYAGGCLVAVVRGANAPKILRTITEQLTQEHKVLDGNAERKEIKDPYLAALDAKEKETEKEEEEEEEEAVKEVTVAVIKPDAVEAGKVDEILEDIKAHGIEILQHEERHLTEEEVKHLYPGLVDADYFDDLCKYMTSGPSHILALTKGKTGENIISEFRELIGPTDVDEAKAQKPESLRAKHGQQKHMNALHGSSSAEMATRELAFFFPSFVAPPKEGTPKVQRTLALVRPEAFKTHKDAILAKINEAGFKVAMQKEIQLTREMAEDFYKEHKGQEYFEQLVTNMSSGPVFALGLARQDAVDGWRNMLGPKEVSKAKEEAPESLRAQFAVDDAINSLHGSDSEEAAKREIEFFFPMEQTVAVIKPDAVGTKDEIMERIHEAGFRIAATKETVLTKEIAESFYADHKDKPFYNDLVEHMTSGPTLFMVLSREDAVQGWRSMIGPTDPEDAKKVAPDSLRATYGQNIKENAVHGSSDPEHAKKTIQHIFGDLRFGADGALLETIDEQAEIDQQEEQNQTENPTAESSEKPVSQETKEVEESSPEVKQAESEQKEKEEAQKEEQQESKQEEEQQQEEEKPSEEQKQEESKTDEPQEQKQEETKTEEQVEAGTQKDEKTEDKSDSEDKKEKKEEPETKEEQQEEKAPSPKPSETEPKPSESDDKPSESEAQPSETDAKPSEEKSEEQKDDAQTEQKTEESTTQGEEEKKEEAQTEQTETKSTTEEQKEEKKDE